VPIGYRDFHSARPVEPTVAVFSHGMLRTTGKHHVDFLPFSRSYGLIHKIRLAFVKSCVRINNLSGSATQHARFRHISQSHRSASICRGTTPVEILQGDRIELIPKFAFENRPTYGLR
jgi:hypothetical protein